MVLYLTEDILKESVTGNQVIDAIDNRVGVLIKYRGEDNEHTGVRYIEPYVYGVTTANNPAIRAYQYYGDSKTGTPAWKLLRLDRIEEWQPTESHFDLEPQARGWAAQAFNGEDKLLSTIYKVVNLEEKPVTDLEKLRARTRDLKNTKPVNITDINKLNQSKQPPVETQKTGGPLGDNTPDTGTPNPEVETKKEVKSQPLNTNGTPKNNEEQPPVRQEPQQAGPIVGNSTEPMSDEDFQKMLKRNLEITDKEKQKRGFNLRNNQ